MEEIHVKGWLRRIGGRQDGDVQLVGADLQSIRYQVTDSSGNQLGNGQAQVNALGGFDFVFAIPKVTNLGTAQLQLAAAGALGGLEGIAHTHAFQIQEFRRPEFEVTARNETAGPYFAGDHATVAVEAKYYAGGALPNAEVTWQITTSPASYAPPNWPDFTFGNWKPWWVYDFGFPGHHGDTKIETFAGKTLSPQDYIERVPICLPNQRLTAAGFTSDALKVSALLQIARQHGELKILLACGICGAGRRRPQPR